MQGDADDARVEDVFDRVAGFVKSLGVVGGVLAVRHLDVRDLFGGRAVIVHVAEESRSEHLACALPTVHPRMYLVARDGSRGTRTGATNTHLRVAVHGTENCHRLAHAGRDHPHGDTNERLGAGATTMYVHVEVQPDPEITGHECRKGRVVPGVR